MYLDVGKLKSLSTDSNGSVGSIISGKFSMKFIFRFFYLFVFILLLCYFSFTEYNKHIDRIGNVEDISIQEDLSDSEDLSDLEDLSDSEDFFDLSYSPYSRNVDNVLRDNVDLGVDLCELVYLSSNGSFGSVALYSFDFVEGRSSSSISSVSGCIYCRDYLDYFEILEVFTSSFRGHSFGVEDYVLSRSLGINLENALTGVVLISFQETFRDYIMGLDLSEEEELLFRDLDILLRSSVRLSIRDFFNGFETYHNVRRGRR